MSQEIVCPDGWKQLDKTDRDSTIAYFVGGAECVVEVGDASRGDEVLVWRGVEDTGDVHLESHLGNDIPDDARFIIEVMQNGELERERFAEDRKEAIHKASNEVKRLHGT